MRLKILKSPGVVACSGALLAGAPPPVGAQQEDPRGPRSPGTAVGLSALGTGVPVLLGYSAIRGGGEGGLLLVSGLVFGPAVGYAHAGEAGRGMAQAGVRALILGATLGGAVAICSAGDCSIGLWGGEVGAELVPAAIVIVVGVVGTAVHAVLDIGRVGGRVRARNQRPAAVSVQPVYYPPSGTAGLVLTLRR